MKAPHPGLLVVLASVACEPVPNAEDPIRTPNQDVIALAVVSGWTEKDGGPIDPDGDLRLLQDSDGDWWSQEAGYFSAFQFDTTEAPPAGDIDGARLIVEHWEEVGMVDGDVTLGLATGPLDAPEVAETTVVPTLLEEKSQARFAWSIDADLDELVVVVTNASAEGKKTLINHLYVELTYDP